MVSFAAQVAGNAVGVEAIAAIQDAQWAAQRQVGDGGVGHLAADRARQHHQVQAGRVQVG